MTNEKTKEQEQLEKELLSLKQKLSDTTDAINRNQLRVEEIESIIKKRNSELSEINQKKQQPVLI